MLKPTLKRHQRPHSTTATKPLPPAVLPGAGLNIGVVLLEQLIPGSSAVTPIAGTLIARKYSRQEEFAADRHGMELLVRAGFPPQTMERTLQWILSQEKHGGGGGFLSSHPATEDRIAALRK